MLRFHDGTNLETAIGRLSECVLDGQDFVVAFPVTDCENSRLFNYVRWVESTQKQLDNVFPDLALVHQLRTTGYWAIRDSYHQAFRVSDLISTEVKEQVRWLQALIDRLRRIQGRLDAATGRPTVLDTNVLLHYEPPWHVKWPTVVREQEVRLVLPLRVVEELDEKKYTSRGDLADRARGLLSQLWQRLGESAGGPVHLRENTTIEVPVEEGRRERSWDADEEILESCEQLRNVGRAPILVTGDTAMKLRGKARRLDVMPMPDRYRRVRE
jgi:hypothetical protein